MKVEIEKSRENQYNQSVSLKKKHSKMDKTLTKLTKKQRRHKLLISKMKKKKKKKLLLLIPWPLKL